MIPVGAPLKLQWADRIRNQTTTFTDPTQEYRVEIRNTANQVLAIAFSSNPGDPQFREWTERSFDLSAFAGQTVRIAFVEQNATANLNIHVDNVRLTNATALGTIVVNLAPGQIVTNANFGNKVAPPGEIHGFKWNDLNGNGVWEQPDEPALAGTLIYIDRNANGSLDFEDTWTTTGADGSYAFTGLPAGEYVVAEVVMPGWTQTHPAEAVIGTDRLFVVRGSGTVLSIYELNPISGAVINAFAAPATTSPGPLQGLAVGPKSLFYIEGSSTSSPHTLWELNPDTGAIIDSDVVDPTTTGPIGGLAYLNGKVYVEKLANNQLMVWDPVTDTLVTTLTTQADLNGGLTGAADLGALFASNSQGNIFKINPTTGAVLNTFAPGLGNLSNGLAYVNGELIAARASLTPGTAARVNPNTGAVLGNFTFGGTGNVGAMGGDGAGIIKIKGAHGVQLAPSQIVHDVNFGNWIAPPGEIRGLKWNDLNGDRQFDFLVEPVIAGQIIYLDANHNGALDGNETWTTTGADGTYKFTGLPAGEYVVAEVLQPGWAQTLPNAVHHERERLFMARGSTTVQTIYELDPETGATINSFTAPTTGTVGTQGLALGPHSLFYINGSGSLPHTLYELDPDTGAIIDSDVVDATPLVSVIGGLAYLNGKIYIERPSNNQIVVWDPVTDSVVTTFSTTVDLVGGLTGAADLGVLLGGGGGIVSAINPANGLNLGAIAQAGGTAVGLAYIHSEIVVARSTGTAVRIDPSTGADSGTIHIGRNWHGRRLGV